MPYRNLGDIADVFMPTRFARPKADKGYGTPIYSSADIMRSRRKPSAIISKRAEKHLKKYTIESGTILVCRSGVFGGIMGNASFVSSAMDGCAITEHMVRCKAS